MSETSNINIDLSTLFNEFGVTRLETAKDEGLLSVENCRNRVLEAINVNIQNYKNNSWNKSNQMSKLLIDLGKNKKGCIFSLRLGGKRIYRCSCITPNDESKITFLTKMYDVVSRHAFDEPIIKFCEKEVNIAEARRQKQREKARAKRKAKAEQAKAEAKKNAEIVQQAKDIINRTAGTLDHTVSIVMNAPTA